MVSRTFMEALSVVNFIQIKLIIKNFSVSFLQISSNFLLNKLLFLFLLAAFAKDYCIKCRSFCTVYSKHKCTGKFKELKTREISMEKRENGFKGVCDKCRYHLIFASKMGLKRHCGRCKGKTPLKNVIDYEYYNTHPYPD